MIEAAALAAGILAGVPWLLLLALVLAWTSPVAALALSGVVALGAGRERGDLGPALWLAVASELRAGNSLRGALGRAAEQEGLLGVARLASAGAELDLVIDRLSQEIGGRARGLRAVVAVAGASGAPSAAAFERLAAGHTAVVALRREKRAAMAPALAQAAVVGGIPAVVTAGTLVSGSARHLTDLGGRLAALGTVLVAIGVGIMIVMARRALR